MSSDRRLTALLLVVAWSLGCGDLVIDVSDEEKDNVAVYVEAGGAGGAPPDREPIQDLSEVTRLEHLAWDAVLKRFNEDGDVQYAAFWASPDHRELLESYLDTLAEVDPLLLESESERLAFWINAYNALVFRGVVEGLTQDPGFRVDEGDFAFFKVERYVVGGEVYSLDALEHGVIRGDRAHASVSGLSDEAWIPFAERHASLFPDGVVDPRIHVGLNCAARSCPPLPSYAFTGPELDAQLTERAARFVQDPERGAGPEGISMLFNWFSADFSAVHGSPRGFVESYRDDVGDVDFDRFLPYDWALNGP
ncbi:MAG: hypothetical protein CMH57_02215 [Myxococcales bacterium]|nr:hypothetical protein [Myxococcales bacterium]